MPRNGRSNRKSVGVQCVLDKETEGSRERRYSEQDSSISRRVIKTPGYRNLLRNTISVIPNHRERRSLSEDDRSKGIQTNIGNEIYLLGVRNELFTLESQRRTESSFRNSAFSSERRQRDTILPDQQDTNAAPGVSSSFQVCF